MELLTLDFLARWAHTLFGITWIGLLYYFNFIQGGYFKQASPEALADAKTKLAPSALWWFRWGAMFTFLTGVILLGVVGSRTNGFIVLGATMGTLMFLNVWLVIWPNQKIALGLNPNGGDAAAAGAKALLASRTNTLFSAPMLMGMFGSFHGAGSGAAPLASQGFGVGLIVALVIVLALEANALFGKQGPMTTVKGVIISSLVLTVVLAAILQTL
ncbi:MAG: urate hydroxylase PuuD [Pseudohongiella sp.]|uniref:urate hydroxylase PuuD n=1 Tax=Pseudohongiella sp. TaxID=1979412 RepID=UPI00349FD3A6